MKSRKGILLVSILFVLGLGIGLSQAQTHYIVLNSTTSSNTSNTLLETEESEPSLPSEDVKDPKSSSETEESLTPTEEGKDTLAQPTITLNGDRIVYVEALTDYEERGANAYDGSGVALPIQMEGRVDTQTVGSYTLTYTAQDRLNQAVSIQREVQVTPPSHPSFTHYSLNKNEFNPGEELIITLSADGFVSRFDDVFVSLKGTMDDFITIPLRSMNDKTVILSYTFPEHPASNRYSFNGITMRVGNTTMAETNVTWKMDLRVNVSVTPPIPEPTPSLSIDFSNLVLTETSLQKGQTLHATLNTSIDPSLLEGVSLSLKHSDGHLVALTLVSSSDHTLYLEGIIPTDYPSGSYSYNGVLYTINGGENHVVYNVTWHSSIEVIN